MHDEWNVAVAEELNRDLVAHLIRPDGQEDLAFAIWAPSKGVARTTALLKEWIAPLPGDRDVHGNASFSQQYFERACRIAMQRGYGVAFLHSHPFPGWQDMSEDDIAAEEQMAGAALALTGQPLVGLTLGSDGTWSARRWEHAPGNRRCRRAWCSGVRVVGEGLQVHFADHLRPAQAFRNLFRRTVEMWGSENHRHFTRLRVGIVGLGSVGAVVAESLARMAFAELVLIDFDSIEEHNLDRLIFGSERDIGSKKVQVAKARILEVATANGVVVRAVESSIATRSGYLASLDCDVLFSCVDRPLPREILNHVAYAHLIPVIDGGIAARFRNRTFRGVDWQVQTVAPSRPCLRCLGAYDPADAATERAGKLDDSTYLKGLPNDHHLKRNENVFPFAINLASLEVLHLIALVTGAAGIHSFGTQRFRYIPGILEVVGARSCNPTCDMAALIATGDTLFSLVPDF
jgi:molybdopterin/thiamine biosynthesis adenylyltransferase